MTFTDKLKELVGKATKGPWYKCLAVPTVVRDSAHARQLFRCYKDGVYGENPEANAALICHLVNHAEDIVALVEALERINKIAGNVVEMERYTARDALRDVQAIRSISVVAVSALEAKP